MATKLTSLLGIVMVATFAGCYQCPDFEYFVETNWTIENAPKNDTLTVGDTLWVSSEFKDELVDINTKELIRLEDTAIKFSGGPIEIYKNDSGVDSKYTSKQALGSFILISNDTYYTDIRRQDYYELRNSEYKIRLGYIAKKKGNYVIQKNPHTSGSYQGSK